MCIFVYLHKNKQQFVYYIDKSTNCCYNKTRGDDIMSKFNERIKELRNKKNISQAVIAEYLGITKQAYSLYETGKREPDYETLLKIGEYFNVSVDYLLGNSDIPETEELPEELIILNRKAKKMSPENRQKLLDMATIMFEEDFNE